MKLLIYSFLILIAPCNGFKKITQTSNPVIIEYRTSACFGHCPIYTLTIDGEKKLATFIGEKNTDKIGTYTKSISTQELNDFIKAFENAKFNSLDDKYLGTIVDFPHRFIAYTNKGKTKKIEVRSEVPEAITSLEAMLSSFSKSEGWKKAEPAANPKD